MLKVAHNVIEIADSKKIQKDLFFYFLRATQANPGAKNEYLSDVKMF